MCGQNYENVGVFEFLNLLMYDVAQTVRPLTSYSTKNSNSGTVRKRDSGTRITENGEIRSRRNRRKECRVFT
jgi:hypothetical protein